jgi:hypothetical protein
MSGSRAELVNCARMRNMTKWCKSQVMVMDAIADGRRKSDRVWW